MLNTWSIIHLIIIPIYRFKKRMKKEKNVQNLSKQSKRLDLKTTGKVHMTRASLILNN